VARWIRRARRLDQRVRQAYQLYEAVRDETFVALASRAERDGVTLLAYGEEPARYSEGSRHFRAGLFDWEKAALRTMGVRQESRVLVGGAGGGRELLALSTMVRSVVGFEPVPELCEAARRLSERSHNIEVHLGSYAEFVEAARQNRGPLAGVPGAYDAVVLGRGSFGHVTDPGEQLELLRAIRATTGAPVLLSCTLRRRHDDLGHSARARRLIRKAYGRLAGVESPPGLRYERGRGFVYHFTEAEIRELAGRAGYRVTQVETSATPLDWDKPAVHAILIAG
jgi:hypothetical protein